MLITLVAIGIVLAAIVLGGWKGFAWQLAGIVSLVLGFVVAIPLSKVAAPIFGSTAPLNRFVAMAVLYAATSLGVYIVAFVYRSLLERWQLHHWDRHLGAVFGGIKGWLLVLVLTLFAVTLSSRARESVLRTPMGKYAAMSLDAIHPVFPPEVHDILHPYVHQLEPDHPH
jgi:membrane protein required for colicin V production